MCKLHFKLLENTHKKGPLSSREFTPHPQCKLAIFGKYMAKGRRQKKVVALGCTYQKSRNPLLPSGVCGTRIPWYEKNNNAESQLKSLSLNIPR